MSTPTTIKNALQAAITKANTVTGENDTTVTEAVNSLIEGYGQGGIVPSGSLTITNNGSYDVTHFANAVVNVSGLNAKIYTVTIASDQTGITYLVKNDWLLSLRDNPNAFVIMRFLGTSPSVAAVHMSMTANFIFYYGASTSYKSIVMRSTATSGNNNADTRGLSTESYNGHLNITTSGQLYCYGNASYPIKAGEYQIIAGVVETL